MPELRDLEEEVHLYYLPTDRSHDAGWRALAENTLSSEEKERARRLQQVEDRRSYIAAHCLLRRVLSLYRPVVPSEWEFQRTFLGKPEISAPSEGTPLKFNLSHTRGVVACAVTQTGEVGVDVETIQPREFLNLASRFFAPSEVAQLEDLPTEDQGRVFFSIWTLKEAYIKALGKGLSLDLAGIAFPNVMRRDIRIEFAEGWEDNPEDWQFFQAALDVQTLLACAVHQASHPRVSWRVFSEIPTTDADGNTL